MVNDATDPPGERQPRTSSLRPAPSRGILARSYFCGSLVLSSALFRRKLAAVLTVGALGRGSAFRCYVYLPILFMIHSLHDNCQPVSLTPSDGLTDNTVDRWT